MRGILWGLARVSLAIALTCAAALVGTGGHIRATVGMNLIAGVYLGLLGYFLLRWRVYVIWEEGEWDKHYPLSNPLHPFNRPWWFPLAV